VHWEYTVPVRRKQSVQQFVDLITERGRHKYKYDGNGSGCLFWSTTMLEDYARLGWVLVQSVNQFNTFVGQIRQAEKGKYWIPEDQGTFL